VVNNGANENLVVLLLKLRHEESLALLSCVKRINTLVATEVFIANLIVCSTCFGHHYAHHQELKSIIRWLLPVVFRAVKM